MGKNLHALVTNKVTYVHGKERRFDFCSLLSKDYYSATYITIIDISIWHTNFKFNNEKWNIDNNLPFDFLLY